MILQKFPENFMKSKEFGRPEGGGGSLAPLLDPKMHFAQCDWALGIDVHWTTVSGAAVALFSLWDDTFLCLSCFQVNPMLFSTQFDQKLCQWEKLN